MRAQLSNWQLCFLSRAKQTTAPLALIIRPHETDQIRANSVFHLVSLVPLPEIVKIFRLSCERCCLGCQAVLPRVVLLPNPFISVAANVQWNWLKCLVGRR